MMPSDPTMHAFLDKLRRQDEERRGIRKLSGIDIDEVSAVTNPAQQAPGWLVLKSAGSAHEHWADAFYPYGAMQQTANFLDLKPGGEKELAKDRHLGKHACGCVYLRSPESVAKAAGEDFVRQHHDREAIAKDASLRWTDEDFARLDNNNLLGRDS